MWGGECSEAGLLLGCASGAPQDQFTVSSVSSCCLHRAAAAATASLTLLSFAFSSLYNLVCQ